MSWQFGGSWIPACAGTTDVSSFSYFMVPPEKKALKIVMRKVSDPGNRFLGYARNDRH
ncbi:MAG: hypothetical protein U1D67_04545 [Dehalococcoidia bacterium]|nr:hypothetical protein [Dehalococcoidia bacterium]